MAKSLTDHGRGIERLAAAQHGVITAPQLAELLSVERGTVHKRANAIGAVLAGRIYLLTPAEAKQIAAALEAPGKRGPKPRVLSG